MRINIVIMFYVHVSINVHINRRAHSHACMNISCLHSVTDVFSVPIASPLPIALTHVAVEHHAQHTHTHTHTQVRAIVVSDV